MPVGQQQLEALRAARTRAIDRLTEHFERDDLDVSEFESRLGRAHRAESTDEIDRLLADLPAVETRTTTATALQTPPPATLATRSRSSVAVAVMGGARRYGTWTPPRRLWAVAVMGGVELDFREARLPPGVTYVDVVAVMGGVEIIVPPQLAIDVSGFGFMGGFDAVERAPAVADPDVPVLRVRGFALMGGCDVRTRLPGESEREARRRERHESRLSRR